MRKIMTRPRELCCCIIPNRNLPGQMQCLQYKFLCISSLQTGTNNDKCNARCSTETRLEKSIKMVDPLFHQAGPNKVRLDGEIIGNTFLWNDVQRVIMHLNKERNNLPCPDECWLPAKSSLLWILRVWQLEKQLPRYPWISSALSSQLF